MNPTKSIKVLLNYSVISLILVKYYGTIARADPNDFFALGFSTLGMTSGGNK
jgi:hypothetical protein